MLLSHFKLVYSLSRFPLLLLVSPCYHPLGGQHRWHSSHFPSKWQCLRDLQDLWVIHLHSSASSHPLSNGTLLTFFLMNIISSSKHFFAAFTPNTLSTKHKLSIRILNLAQVTTKAFQALPCFSNVTEKGWSTSRCCTSMISIQLFLSMRNGWMTFNPVPPWTVSKIGTHLSWFYLGWGAYRKEYSAMVVPSFWEWSVSSAGDAAANMLKWIVFVVFSIPTFNKVLEHIV